MTGEITAERARSLLDGSTGADDVKTPTRAYGSNMTARMALLRVERFDHRLPAYAWLEDHDFWVRASRHGDVVLAGACLAVHRGVSGGRVSGLRLGCSQTLNPYYLWRKGTLKGAEMVGFWLRVVSGNILGLLRRDRSVDRLARLRGNLVGFREVMLGSGDPGVIEQLP